MKRRRTLQNCDLFLLCDWSLDSGHHSGNSLLKSKSVESRKTFFKSNVLKPPCLKNDFCVQCSRETRAPDLFAAVAKNLKVQRGKLQKARDNLQGSIDEFEDCNWRIIYIYIYRSQSKNSRNFPIVGGIFLKIATYLIHVENTPQEETCKASTENGTAALENYAEFLTSVRI